MPITKHREKILEALREWFRIHKEGPTLEELCRELGKKPSQKATVQKWLQTMRGIDIEWDDNMARSIHLLAPEPEEPEVQLSSKETLRYLASGLAEWERQKPEKRDRVPTGLRMGMSFMYLASLLKDEKAPANLPEFFEGANKPLESWSLVREVKNLPSDVTLIDDGLISDFAAHWQVTGSDLERQVQESVLLDALNHCRGHQMDDEYRAYRKLIIEKPVLSHSEYRKLLSSTQLRPLRKSLLETYVDLVDFAEELADLAEDNAYHFCPRCNYLQRRRSDGTYQCRNSFCEDLCAELKLMPRSPIPKSEAKEWKIVTSGVYRYGTLPGIWEIKLAKKLSKLGLKVTLWPRVDKFDLLVEFGRKLSWAIDVKDWSSLDEEHLKEVKYQPDFQETFIVFPDEREKSLRTRVMRQELEPKLGGIKLRLIGEIIDEAKAILEKKKHARDKRMEKRAVPEVTEG
ncbi:MAG: Fis family transcriptional regulator [Oscillatoria sp. SIO1A7]|nr:Fis family transcriptional regulator [Oscillatoria sp. SIO1A7]